jgi:hypothetical protein
MPLAVDENLPTKFPEPQFLTLTNFKRGVITLIDKSRLPKDALEAADNIFLYEDGQPGPRPGVDWYGTAPITTVTSSLTVPATASGTSWTNASNVFASDDARAVFATTTQLDLKITNFSFNIPTTATITGVTISVEGNGTDATAANRSVELGLTKDGTTLSGTRAASQNLNQTTDTTLTFGGSSSMFSTTLTPAEVNLSTFGVLLRAANTNAGARNIDQVKVQITYTNSFAIDGFDYFDFAGVIHMVMVTGGYIHRSTNDGLTWTQCTGATLTAGVTANFNQYNSYLHITNGTEDIVRYDGSTTLVSYTTLTTPAAATIAKTGLAGTSYTVYYKISAVNAVGFSIASASVSQTVGSTRGFWDATSNYLTLTLPAPQATQTRADIYYSDDDVNYYYIDSIISSTGTPNVTYKDDGSAVIIPSTTAPTGNTSQGPKVAELTNVGSRMYGVRDTNNRYRIWFSSGQPPFGAFSSAYDGGYLDWQPGGKYIPKHIEDYRDGKNNPVATVWCDSADGQGCILQMTLDTLTIGDISVTVPSAIRLPGSRGTTAPGSVVNVLNDYYFYNNQAFYNLGSRAQFLNLLSTDEASANIRPTVRGISPTGAANISSVYFDARVYFSVPYGGTTPNYTIVYDTERKAWLPKAFTIGFTKFLRYTDTGGVKHLLALKDGDTKLSEISTDIQGDYGVAFETSLLTGLYPVTKDRFEFQWTEEGEFELSNPQGTVDVELLGYHRTRGFTTIKDVQLTEVASTVDAGWDTFDWDTSVWDDTSVVATTFSESSVKRYFVIQKELNAIQWHISTSSLTGFYVLRTLQTWGTPTQAGHPKQWRLS